MQAYRPKTALQELLEALGAALIGVVWGLVFVALLVVASGACN